MAELGLLPPMDVIYASDLEQPSSNDSYEVEDVESSSLLYERHGQWTCMRSTPLDLITRSKQLSGESQTSLHDARNQSFGPLSRRRFGGSSRVRDDRESATLVNLQVLGRAYGVAAVLLGGRSLPQSSL